MRTKIGTSWQQLTNGQNYGIVSAEGRIMMYIGATAPGANDAGIPYIDEKIQAAPPAQVGIKSGEQTPIDAVLFNY